MTQEVDDADRERARQAVEDFAHVLSDARSAAGEPSFRKMAGRSGCISHTTLHEATKGNRFPSWDTVTQFAVALGLDPQDFRQRWEEAEAVVNPPQEEVRPVVQSPAPVAAEANDVDEPAVGATAAGPPVDKGGRRHTWLIPAIVAALVVLLAVTVTALILRNNNADRAAAASSSTTSTAPTTTAPASTPRLNIPAVPGDPAPDKTTSWAACPIKDQLGDAPPLHSGDHATFVADITYPDCASVRPGEHFTKIFTLKNSGTVPWHGRRIVRVDLPLLASDLGSAKSTSIPDAQPGQTVQVRIPMTAPERKGLTVAKWMMADGDRWAFPGQRSYKVQLEVK